MEHRREYETGDIVGCPKCDSINLDTDDAPDHAKCLDCGCEFSIKTVAVWED